MEAFEGWGGSFSAMIYYILRVCTVQYIHMAYHVSYGAEEIRNDFCFFHARKPPNFFFQMIKDMIPQLIIYSVLYITLYKY